jgi:mannan endo-1,4-beta-mannosidase
MEGYKIKNDNLRQKKHIFFAIFTATQLFISANLSAQIGFNTDNSLPDPSAMLDVKSNSKGMLIPRMTQSQISAITTPANGLIVFCVTDNKFYAYIASANVWKEILYGSGTIAPDTVPSLTTTAVTNITQTAATSGGNVTSDGGATVTARGVCWSTSSNPATTGIHTSDGTGTGTFTSTISGLTANTTYHIRAYATNIVGTSYGNDLSFTTLAIPPILQYIHTSGMYLLGPCGDTLLLRGINYAPYHWGYDISSLEIGQIAQTGANVVRMVWYWNNPDPNTNAVYLNYVALDSAISKCLQHKMIAIVEIHDYTCSTDTTGLLNLNTWWIQASVFTNILQKYKESVIVNYANEALFFDYASNPTKALATYKHTYQNIITALRNVNGFKFPVMIDAPDCGTNSDAFITSNVANDLIQFDPQHNLIFSAHTYWYSFANNDSAQMAAKINAVLAQNIPLVLGEVSNLQDDVNPCQYVLHYKPLLNFCQQKKVSWLAWSWDNDVCPARQVSSNGNFNSLTTYGNDIVNNSTYGLLPVSASKSRFLLNGCNTGK